MASANLEVLGARAESMNIGEVVSGFHSWRRNSPSVVIPSVGLKLSGDRSWELRRGFDSGLPIIARVEDGDTYLDFRTIDPDHDQIVSAALGNLD